MKQLEVPCKPGSTCLHVVTDVTKIAVANEAINVETLRAKTENPEGFDENMNYALSRKLTLLAKEFLVPTLLGIWFEEVSEN